MWSFNISSSQKELFSNSSFHFLSPPHLFSLSRVPSSPICFVQRRYLALTSTGGCEKAIFVETEKNNTLFIRAGLHDDALAATKRRGRLFISSLIILVLLFLPNSKEFEASMHDALNWLSIEREANANPICCSREKNSTNRLTLKKWRVWRLSVKWQSCCCCSIVQQITPQAWKGERESLFLFLFCLV